MNHADFRKWESGLSTAMYTVGKPPLHDVVEAKFERGSALLHFKTEYGVTEYYSCRFLEIKIEREVLGGTLAPNGRQLPRGIPSSKLNLIKQNLCPLIPRNRRGF